MSEAAKTARNAMKDKAKRLTSTDPHTKVDSSTWTPPEAENAGVKTGARPLVKRLYKKGGRVVGKAEGAKAKFRADRKPRKAGGRAEHKAPWVDDLINRDVRMANDVREGVKHEGGFKKGGKIHKEGGGSLKTETIRYPVGERPKGIGWSLKSAGEQTGKDHSVWTRNYKNVPKPSFENSGNDQIGKKSGGRAHKFGGGMIANNPVSNEDMSMSRASGMMVKKGGRVHREAGGPSTYGDAPSSDPIGDMIKANPMPKKTFPSKSSALPSNFKGISDAERAANAAAFDKQQQEYQRSLPQNQKRGGKTKADGHKVDWLKRATGGKAEHSDEAQDKKLMHKVLKEDAFKRPAKASGGLMGRYIRGASMDAANSGYKEGLDTGSSITNLAHKTMFPDAPRKTTNRLQGIRTAVAKMGGPGSDDIKVPATDDGMKKGGRTMHHKDCTCKMCGGGRAMKYGGGGVFSGNSKEKIPGATGGRTAHAKGGKAGKTTINIVMGGHGQQPQNYPNAPVMPPRPPAGVPVPPPATAGGAPMMPPQGMPPQMPPQGGDMPMPRKSGGRIGKLGGGSLGSQMGSAGNGMGRGAMLGAGAGGMPNTNGPRGGNPTPPLFGGGNVQPTGPMTGMGYAKMMQTMNGQGVPFPSAQGGQNVPPPPPPFFGQGGQGGNPPPVQGYAAPPNMMPRKSGGRTNYPIDTGAGGANARLEKIDAYGLKPSKRK